LGAFGSLKSDGNPDGESALYDGIQFLDYTIAHEMTHAVMKATVNNFNALPQFIVEGIADLTIGGDRRRNYIEDFASGKKSLKDALNLNDNGTANFDSYVAGYMFLRWLTKQTSERFPVNLNNTVSSSVLEGTNFNDTIYSNAENVTIKAGKGADSIYSHGNAAEVWGESGNDTVQGDYATSKIYGGEGNDFISLTTYSFNSIDGGAGHDTIITGGRKHSVNGGSGNDRISLSGDDLTINGGKGSDTIYSVGDRVSIFGGKGNDSIQNGALETNSKGGDSVSVNFGSGDNFFFNMQGKNVTLQAGSGKDSIHNYRGDSLRVNLGGGNDYFNAYQSKNVTVSGGDGADNLNAKGGEKFYCNAGAGNDTVWISDGMKLATVIGGKGNDSIRLQDTTNNLIKYSSGDGKDTITGFSATDTLSIADVSYSTKASGSDLRVTVGKGSLLLKDAKKLTSNIVLSVTNSTKSPVTVSSTVKNIDASKRTKAVKITGNKLANSIAGGSKNDTIYGGAGNDTLRGGKGNDKLWGDAGKDTFLYASGDGKDIIYGFENNDMLKITGAFKTSYSKSKKEIYFDVGSTAKAVTLKDFGTTSTFNVNGDVYHISGKKLVK
ncbi:MAG: calcium-binding protein, partial [Selenomonadaceae bacterium]|nr:calcium-binding protein [Selenomonadaceae bacterium]